MAELSPTEPTVSVSDITLAPGASYIFAQVTSPKERLRSCTHLYDPGQLFILYEAQSPPVYTESTNVYFVALLKSY